MTEQTFPAGQADRRWMRTVTGLALGLTLMATAVACGKAGHDNRVATANGSASATASAGTGGHGDALKFAQCMRANGVTEWPDPDPANPAPKVPPGPPDERIKAATEKCKQYMPNGGEPPKMDPQEVEAVRKFAQCMRDNGLADFPDPQPNGGVGFAPSAGGMDPNSAQFKAAEQKCQHLMPRRSDPAGPGGAG
jgi:hypothetical protein